ERDDGDWGTHWGASTVEVKKFIESLGLQFSESDTSVPDHISVEMELMQRVIAKELQSWNSDNRKDALHYLKIEKLFIDDHINKWVPSFCDKIIAAAELPFYREMAALTKKYIELEMTEISDFITEAMKDN
ncbi:molecular chaperone TorD family protein, partial [bacterium]|nr:molecular chaperone TorD family protein [bacterium]